MAQHVHLLKCGEKNFFSESSWMKGSVREPKCNPKGRGRREMGGVGFK